MIYINNIVLDFDPHNENIRQKASSVKKYCLKVANDMERLLWEINSEDFELTSEVFDITEIYVKTDTFIAVLGIDKMTSQPRFKENNSCFWTNCDSNALSPSQGIQ